MLNPNCKPNESSTIVWPSYFANNSTVGKDCFPYLVIPSPTEALLMGQIAPSVIIFTVITNVLICIVLTRRHMISPTNIILLGMAISDMLTGLFPLPVYIAKNFKSFHTPMLVSRCYVNYYLVSFIPTVFHTMSVWLTVTLAIQRFIYITFPVRVSTICTERNSKIATVIALVSAFIFHGIGLNVVFRDYVQNCYNSSTNVLQSTTKLVMKCDNTPTSILMAFHGTRVILLNVLPCLTLALFTILLMIALHQAEAKRKSLMLHSNRKSDSRRMKESNSTSKMLVVVLVSFLVVEFPTGVVISVYMVAHIFNVSGNYDWNSFISVLNFCILVSYPMNFFIYCGMSQQFRNTFRSLIGLEQRSQPDTLELTRGKTEAIKMPEYPHDQQQSALVIDHAITNGDIGEELAPLTSEIN